MFAEERRAEIAKLVASARRVNGADLARRYDVTMETVRRDLAALEEAGKLRRVHGGAVTIEQSTSLESSISSRQGMNTPEKRRIATKAYQMLRDSESGSIVLDAGSTIEILADHIGAENFSLKTGNDRIIITHALHIAVQARRGRGRNPRAGGRSAAQDDLGRRRRPRGRALRHDAPRYCVYRCQRHRAALWHLHPRHERGNR